MELFKIQDKLEEQRADQIPSELPLLPLRNAVIYPYIAMPISVSGPESIKLIEESIAKQKVIGVITQKSGDIDEPKPDDLYTVGTVIKLFDKRPGGGLDEKYQRRDQRDVCRP